MTDSSEHPLVKKEKENFKFGGLTAALGVVAVFAAGAIPNHNRQIRDAQRSLDVAGLVVLFKGTLEGLNAMDKLQELKRQRKNEGDD